jgi:glycosyltransferase involved in cell wall biosynthesis
MGSLNGPQISVIMPAYNEVEGIGRVLEELCLEPALADAELIVIDDGSTDGTNLEVARFPRVRLVKHRINKGYGSAIATGVKASLGQYVVWYDSDWQFRVEDLVQVTQTLVNNDLDYCVGVREKDSYQEPGRLIGKFILGTVVRIAASRPVQDFNSGLRGYRKEVIKRYLHVLPRGFGASTTMTLLMLGRGYYGLEVPIVVRQRLGKSSVKLFRDGFRTLMIILRIFLLFRPMRFFGSIGIALILAGSIYGLDKAFRIHTGFPVLASLVVILGLQAFFFGLISDQISQSRLERFE